MLYNIITCERDRSLLQNDLNSLQNWSESWLLKFHPDKCKYLSIGKESTHQYTIQKEGKICPIINISTEKDIGVTFDAELSFETHITNKINKANSMVGIIRRNYKFLDEDTFIPLYKSLVRCHFDNATSVWSPYKIKHIDQIESVQRRVMKQLPGFKDLSYPERLKRLNLPSLSYRRI